MLVAWGRGGGIREEVPEAPKSCLSGEECVCSGVVVQGAVTVSREMRGWRCEGRCEGDRFGRSCEVGEM